MSETLTVNPASGADVEDIDDEDLRHASAAAAAVDDTVSTPKRRFSLRKMAGNTAFASTAAEVAGIGVDALLMGGGSAGIDVLKSIPVREGIAIGPDVMLIQRIQRWAHNREGHEITRQDAQRKLKKIGGLAVTAVVAIGAQKAGISVLEHANEHSSTLHFMAPLTTKVGAVTAARRALRL